MSSRYEDWMTRMITLAMNLPLSDIITVSLSGQVGCLSGSTHTKATL